MNPRKSGDGEEEERISSGDIAHTLPQFAFQNLRKPMSEDLPWCQGNFSPGLSMPTPTTIVPALWRRQAPLCLAAQPPPWVMAEKPQFPLWVKKGLPSI